MPAALPELGLLVILFGALIVCYLCVYFVKAFLGTAASATSWIPWIGHAVSSGLHKAEQHVTSIFSKAAAGVESAVGWSWHLQARLIDALGREINSHANQLWRLASTMPAVTFAAALLADLRKHGHSISKLWDTVFSHPASLVKPLTAKVTALDRYTRANVKAFDHAIDVTIPGEFKGLRIRTKKLEDELSKAWDAIKAGKFSLGSLAFVGAVALALSKLGLGYLRCNNATNLLKKRKCGLWNDLEDILGLLADAVIFADLCKIIPAATTLFGEIEAPLTELISGAANAVCAQPPKSWAKLPIGKPYTPANPAITTFTG